MNEYRRMNGLGSFRFFPPVLKSLLIINLSIFILQTLILSVFNIDGTSLNTYFRQYFSLMPIFNPNYELVTEYFYPWQLISYQFMHAGLWHLFFNLLALWMFGSELEETWGSAKFLTFYLLSGIGAGISQLLVAPYLGQFAPTVGASGAIYGILLAFGFSFPDRPIFMFPFFIPIPAKIFVFIMAGIGIISGITDDGNVAHLAHLGGMLTGFLLFKFGDKSGIFKLANKIYKPKKKSTFNDSLYSQDYTSFSQEPRIYKMDNKKTEVYDSGEKKKTIIINGEEITQNKIDEILDKISAHGYQSLSEKEKFILTELSKRI